MLLLRRTLLLHNEVFAYSVPGSNGTKQAHTGSLPRTAPYPSRGSNHKPLKLHDCIRISLRRVCVQIVMGMLLAALDMKVPPYIRTDAFVVSYRLLPASAEGDDGSDGAAVELQVTSPHGPRCPMPMLSYALFSFPVSDGQCAALGAMTGH